MIRALVVEDEQTSRHLLNKMVERYLSEKVTIVDSVDSVDSAIASINKNNPDLVINMLTDARIQEIQEEE